MKKDLFPYYIFECLNSIKQHLKAYKKDHEQVRLHNLRIAIKKIRAVYFFIDEIYEEIYTAPNLKTLFKEAGKIREIHINTEVLTTLPRFPKKFIVQLQKEKIKLEDQFIKEIPIHIFVIDHLQKTLLLPVELPRKKIILHYFYKEEKKALKNFREKDRKKVHRSRIKIKRLMYVYDALPDKLQSEIKFNKRKLLQQQEQIGEWHNTFAALRFLSKRTLTKDLKVFLSKLKLQEKSQFEMLYTINTTGLSYINKKKILKK